MELHLDIQSLSLLLSQESIHAFHGRVNLILDDFPQDYVHLHVLLGGELVHLQRMGDAAAGLAFVLTGLEVKAQLPGDISKRLDDLGVPDEVVVPSEDEVDDLREVNEVSCASGKGIRGGRTGS